MIFLNSSAINLIVFPIILAVYFLILIVVGKITEGNSDNATFFRGNRRSPWFLVAFGMIGASLSGVTFLSIPGAVGKDNFSYMQMVLGYFLGYQVIAQVLLPIYYKLDLTSIYAYLQKRFGNVAYKTGAAYFLISRSIGNALRLFLAAVVMQTFIFDNLHIPFEITVFITIALIWLYSFKGGIRTIVYTDTLQTVFMLTALGISIVYIWNQLGMISDVPVWQQLQNSHYSKFFEWDSNQKNFFWKHFFGGMFITIVMTGLDQDMMQKNLTCRSLKDAKKNMFWMSSLLIPVNFLFVMLGGLLYLYGTQTGVIIENFNNPDLMAHGKHLTYMFADGTSQYIKTDQLFPLLAANQLPVLASIFFFIGLIAAAYSTADSSLTALTTSFCVDFLGFNENKGSRSARMWVHIGVSMLTYVIILVFKVLNNDAVINELFKIAGYTYGPLLGMFAFGLATKIRIKDSLIPVVCILSPVICYLLDANSRALFNGYVFGFEILIVNGIITFAGLFLLRSKGTVTV
ncbi:MAG: sodium:solute symporter [Bacteroidetes bacterium]|nr:sodium:solute symporter [Bacteroidota bacterium]